MLIDTHCHINILLKQKFDIPLTDQEIEQAQHIITQARQAGVTTIINVGTSAQESENCIKLAQRYQNNYAVVGIHPNDCTATWSDDLKKIAAMTKKKEENKIVAIGEIGLDYHYPDYNKQRQHDAFRAQVELALEHNLPIVIHTRDAGDQVLEYLEEFNKESTLRGVFHCFSENQAFADYATQKISFFLGIGGTVTYPNNNQHREIVKKIGLEYIVLETDTPYLAPQIVRGKRNHPKHIRDIADYIANLLETDIETVAQITTKNASNLFGL